MNTLDREQQEAELKELLRMIEERKLNYWLMDVDVINWVKWKPPIAKQVELFTDFMDRLSTPLSERVRYMLYYWWNGAWKTFIGSYICVLLAIWHKCEEYWLPFIGAKKNIWIATKSGNNVKTTIHKYLLWEWSPTRIPPEMIKRAHVDNNILKGIYLTNWCKINIVTYDQGREAIQGDTPDFLWMDEEPTNEDVWTELRFRTRWEDCETLITMTPLSWLTPVYRFFFEQTSKEVRDKSRVYHVSALDNPHTDKTLTKWLTEEEYRLRVEWSFENPTGLVYSEFFRSKNVVPHFDPKLMAWNYWDKVKFYRAVDFGTSHPTAVIWIAQDIDDNFYVYDELEVKDTPLSEIVDRINQKSVGYDFEYTVRDSAAAREWLEVAKLWLRTVKANKHEKWANDMSNRRTWIMIINDMFSKWKLLISDRCQRLIRELETHYYKEDWDSVRRKDWEVNKYDDDLLDALRYVIFMIKRNTWVNKKSIFERQFEEKFQSKERIRWF